MLTELPPPPPLPPKRDLGQFHIPGTNIFISIRKQLASLEVQPNFKSDLELPLAFLIAFATGAILGVAFPLALHSAVSPALGPAASWATGIFVAPFSEEIPKFSCMLVVAYALPRVYPNRRYGAAIGATTGLGFAIMEDVIYAVMGLSPGLGGLARLILTPFGHVLFCAFSGIGVFVFISRIHAGKNFFESLFGLPIMFLAIGMLNHSLFNVIATFVPYPISIIVEIFLFPSPMFILILRDFLGGHFNFQHFFEPLPEPSGPHWKEPPPPIEPPPP